MSIDILTDEKTVDVKYSLKEYFFPSWHTHVHSRQDMAMIFHGCLSVGGTLYMLCVMGVGIDRKDCSLALLGLGGAWLSYRVFEKIFLPDYSKLIADRIEILRNYYPKG